MKEVTDYLARAKECREMMQRASPGQKKVLEQIALTWEKLAEEREKALS